MDVRDLVVVGGGAAGVLAAGHVACAAVRPMDVTVVDDGPGRIGAGVAYRSTSPLHLMNIRAEALSAWADDPNHFVSWLAGVGEPAGRNGFVPRATYGRYLAAVAHDAGNGPSAAIDYQRGLVIDLQRAGSGWRVRLADGRDLTARAVILAPGVGRPSLRWAPPDVRGAGRFIGDPWAPGALDAVGPLDRVVLVGSGLTAVDIALVLAGPGRALKMVSRHGWLPHAHVVTARPPLRIDADDLPSSLAGTRAYVRGLVAASVAASGDWRPAIDALRPHTPRIWQAFTERERAEFVRRDARRWEIARHRMAPVIAERIAALRATGQLTVTAVADAADTARRALADGAWVIAATGPDLAPHADPLLARLIARGYAALGRQGLGLATDGLGRLRNRAGSGVTGLYTLGATRRGELWESTAIPEIRQQAAALARHLTRPRAARPHPRDPYGLPLSTTPAAAAHYRDAVHRVLRVQAGAGEALTAALAADPGFSLARAALALLVHEGLAAGRAPLLRVRPGDDARTVSFTRAVAARLDGDGEPLIAHVGAYPLDALAVSAVVPTIAFGGATDVPEHAWAIVEGLAPAYGCDPWYLGLLAFTRQEQRRYAEAADLAERALAADPCGAHAVHARTHVYYETAEHGDGLRFIDGWMAGAGRDAAHLGHFAWHAALHELALDRADEARARFDLQLRSLGGVRALVDAASLLWRVRLSGAWTQPPDARCIVEAVPRSMVRTPATAFVALHAALALAAAEDRAGLAALRRYAAGHPAPVFRELIEPIARALDAFVDGRYHAVAETLSPLRGRWRRLGGSDAQRDVLDDTLIAALMRAGRCGEAQSVLAGRLDRRGLVVAG